MTHITSKYALMTSLSMRSSFMGFVGAVLVSACIVIVAIVNILLYFSNFYSTHHSVLKVGIVAYVTT